MNKHQYKTNFGISRKLDVTVYRTADKEENI